MSQQSSPNAELPARRIKKVCGDWQTDKFGLELLDRINTI
jgi:hypothetical protein